MSMQYDRDDARRLVVITVKGDFPLAEMIPVVERQRAEDTWGYGMLYDLRHMTGRPALSDLRAIMEKVTGPSEQPRGPVAMLTADAALYGTACAYAAMAGSKLRVQVFRDLKEANLWLIAETGP